MVRKTHYELFPTQYKFMFGIDKEAKEKADKILKGSYQDVTLYQGGIGSGKCLGIDTPILMYDGTIKKVQDIVIGDLLLAPDGSKRTVVSLGRGKELMYKIIPNRGDSFICNESHILTLEEAKTSNKIDISVKDYIKKGNKFKQTHYLIRSKAIEFSNQNKDKILPIHPYLYGVWLGDGTLSNNTLSISDNDILKELPKFVPDNCFITTKYIKNHHYTEVRITSKNYYKSVYNIFRKNIYEKYKEKIILPIYKTSSIKDRQYLLAGIIDTDGYSPTNSYKVVSTKSKRLAEDYAFIARSLGFGASVNKREKKLKYKNNEIYVSYDVSISGDFTTLPVLCKKKQSSKDKPIQKNPLRTGFKIEPIGVDNYYGFTLLEGPHFLLGDFTITHNTFCGSLRGLLFAFRWAKSEGLVGAQSQVLLDNTTKQKYIWHLDNMGMKEGEHYWWSDRKTKLTLANGSTIRFYTVSNWETFRSTEFQWIELEEASLIDEKTFKELMGRLRGTPKEEWEDPYFSMFLHTNPQGTRGWIYRFFRNPKTKIEGYRCVTAPSTENTYLPKSYVENLLKLYSAEEVEELIMGLDVNRDNTIAFPDFSLIENVRNLQYNPSHPLILTCDFNYNPMCWYLIQQYDNKWFILKELIFENVTTQEMCKIIEPIIREQYNTKELIIMGDAHGADMKTNGSDYQIMSIYFGDKGYDFVIKVLKSNPFIRDRLAVLRGIIKNAMGERRLFVDESCKRLLYNFDECKNQLSNGGLHIPTDREIEADDDKRYLIHPIDAISYPMYFLSKQRSLGGDEDITL